MAGTQATTTENGNTYTELAEGLRTDEPQDSRDCPHDCHGELTVDDDDTVYCETCRCTPDGVFLPPDNWEDSTRQDGHCSQYAFFEVGLPRSPTFNPKGSRWDSGLESKHNRAERAQYRNSRRRKVVGSFELAYPDEMTSRDDSLI